MNLQSEDKSNKALTVGSLNVLGGMKSDELTAIHTHLQTQDGVQSRIIADMEKLYQSISADGVITANEKQMLKKELTIIETEYPIIVSKAEAAKKEKADIDAYKQAFQKLYHYIYRELKVFDSIQTALEIERTTFNAVFAAYYSSRALLQIAQDGSTKFLPSLEITGDYENQIGTFQGRLYRWTGGKWELLNAVMPLNPVAHYDMADVQSKTIFQHGYFESTGKYDTRLCDLSAYKGKTIQVTVSGYRKGEGGYPSLYIYDINWKWVWYTSFKFNRTSELTLKTTLTIPTAYNTIWCTLYHFPENKMNNTIVMTNLTIELLDERPLIDSSGNNNHATISGNAVKTNDIKVGQILAFNKGSLTRPPQDFIGIGKQWSHSRWIKMNGDAQDKTVNPRLWRYGAIDYCYTDIAANSGVMQSIYIVTYKTNSEAIGIAIPKVNIADDKWHNLIVCNDVQSTYARKIVYLDGKLIEDTTVNGDFTGLINDQNVDMSAGTDYVKGSLANLLFFDRLLTEQEALYLCLNPQYPVKNYTLADWAIDPANPDSNIKNLTPKYLGVTETVPPTRTVLITKGERLGAQDANAGDWVLMGKTVGGWKVGVCYRWTGRMWINLEPEYNYTEQYQAALYHICEIEELMQNTGHFGALFAKALVVQKALIDNLITKNLLVDSDINNLNDFEAKINKIDGVLVRNKNKTILEVSPTGKSVFTGEVNVGAIQLIDSGIFLKDGEISIENAGWKGVLKPCKNGVELCIMGGDGGRMKKKQLYTSIAGGIMSLFVLGSITCCEGMYKGNTRAVKNSFVPKYSDATSSFDGVTVNDNTWIVVGIDGTILVSADNGNTWTKKTSGTAKRLRGVAVNGNTWVAVGDYSTILVSADNGNTWTKKTGIPNEFFCGVAVNDNTWVVVGSNGTILVSADNGNTWTKKTSGTAQHLNGVAVNGNTWVAVGERNTILVSADNGNTWTKKTSGTAQHLNGVAVNGNTWVAVGEHSTILVSADNGNTWTKKISGVTNSLNGVAVNDNTWVAVGAEDILVSSDNGNIWIKKLSDTTGIFSGVAVNDNTCVVAGGLGTILVSRDAAVWEP